MIDALLVLVVALVAPLLPVSLCVFAVAQRDRWPVVCALFFVAILGLQYCSMRLSQ